MPVLAAAAVLLLAERMSAAFKLDIDPDYYHLAVVDSFVSGTSFGDSLYPRVDLPFRPDAYPLTGHGLAAELVVATGGIGALLVLGVASVVLLMLAAVSISSRAVPVPVPAQGVVQLARRSVVVGMLAGLFVALPTVIDLAAGMPSDVIACAALAALIAVAFRDPAQLPLVGGLAGVAVGAKTTTLIPVVIVVAVVVARRGGAIERKSVLIAAALFVLAGGHWFVRDLLAHGSPLWPQLALPWGTPGLPWFDAFARFVDHPITTLREADPRQLANFGLGVPLTIAAVLTAAPARLRYAMWACLGAAILAWAATKQTGIAPGSQDSKIGFGAASRYFAPVQILAAAMVCHLVSLGSRRALLLGCAGGLVNLAVMAKLLWDHQWGLTVAVVLAVLSVCAAVAIEDARPIRRWRAVAAVAVGVVAVPGVALATSHQRLWTQAIQNSRTPYVKERRACLIDRTCTAHDGDRLRVTESPGFRLGPELDVRATFVP
jgi:hypothetical protein